MFGGMSYEPTIGGIVTSHKGDCLWMENCVNTGVVKSDDSVARAGIIAYGTTVERMINCFNLKPSCKTFCILMMWGVITDPSGSQSQYVNATNSDNCADIDELWERLSSACPGVFVREGDNIKLAGH